FPADLGDRRPAIPPELVVGAADVGVAVAGVTVVAIVPFHRPLGKGGRLGLGEKLLAGKLGWPLERGQGGKTPGAGQVRLWLFRALTQQDSRREREKHRHRESSAHTQIVYCRECQIAGSIQIALSRNA